MTTITLPDGCRLASDDENGWYYQALPGLSLWITDGLLAAQADVHTPLEASSDPVTPDAGQQVDPKQIAYNRADRDYTALYDGQYIGSYATYHQAEVALDDHALGLLQDGLIDTVPASIYARPAEPAVLYECSCGAADPLHAALADHPNLRTVTDSLDHARRALQENICGQYLNAAYCDDPAGFLARFDGWHPRTQAAATRAVAAFLGEPMGRVDEVWVTTREMLRQTEAPV